MRIRELLDFDWRFELDGPDYNSGRRLDDSEWRVLNLPHDWSIELVRSPETPSEAHGGFAQGGVGWYRKHFEASKRWCNQVVTLEFEGAYRHAEVWLNDHYLGHHPYGYTSFTYGLSPHLDYENENVLVVRVDNTGHRNTRWYSGSGIYRHVWLNVTDRTHIKHWGNAITTPDADENSSTVSVKTSIVNELDVDREVDVVWSISGVEGQTCASFVQSIRLRAHDEMDAQAVMTIAEPALWSPDSPVLYALETKLIADGELIDSGIESFGIRRLDFSVDEGFLLNGQPTLLKGGCVHHDCGLLGAASYDDAEVRKVSVLKSSGFNAIRCAHNPPSPAFLDACDRLGMLVIDEAFDIWCAPKVPYDYHLDFPDWWERDLDNMLRRDGNHPCVIMWSIGNELPERFLPEGAAIAEKLAKRVRTIDPTRPVTAGINGDGCEWERIDPLFEQLDICGYNYQVDKYEPDHLKHPDRLVYASESFPFHAYEYWQAVLKHPHVLGDFVWTSHDYLGESGIGRTHYGEGHAGLGDFPWFHANCGDIDICGFKRPQSYYRDLFWKDHSPLYIAVHEPVEEEPSVSYWGWPDVKSSWTWDVADGYEMKVDIYSNSDEVELILNDNSLGKAPVDERLTASFAVPFSSGTLKAIGYVNGKPVEGAQLSTASEPAALKLSSDETGIAAAPQSLCYVCVEIQDANGMLHPNADNGIRFSLEGPATIAAVGNADPKNTALYQGDSSKAFNGRCLVVLRSTGDGGEIRLTAKADGLHEGSVTVQAAGS